MCVDGGVASRLADGDLFADMAEAEERGRQVGHDVPAVAHAAKMRHVLRDGERDPAVHHAGHTVGESKAIVRKLGTQGK